MDSPDERGDGGRRRRLQEVGEAFGLADVYVFGSRADEIQSQGGTGPGQPDSDVDIAVRPRQGRVLAPRERADMTTALERALQVKRVDLVLLPEASAFLALAAIKGHLLYCADTVDQAEYELFVLRRAGDLAPFERERQRIVLEGGR